MYISTHEYKPQDIENVAIENSKNTTVLNKDEISVLSFNTGYAGLGNNADFFMDGGKNVKSADENRLGKNITDITSIIKNANADFTILQEVDIDSHRSYRFDEASYYSQQTGFSSTFTFNHRCFFVPYPIPPIGKVAAGQVTLTPYTTDLSQRVSLPCPFKWPVRTANLKRCLLVNYYPIENSDKQLVIVNLHLEAYDNGEGKQAQTEKLIRTIEEEYKKGNYVIAGGDFNQAFPGSNEKYPQINEKYWKANNLENSMLPEGWQFAYDLKTPSCRLLDKPYDANNENNQFYCIDGFIVSPNIKINSVEVLDYNFKASDHNPVYLKATLK